MNDRSLRRAFTFYVVSITYCIIQTILAWLFFGFLTSAYRDGVLPSSPLIQVFFKIAVVVLLIAMLAFVCAMYGIALWSAVSEVRARNRHFKLNYDLRQHDLQQRQRHERERETTPLGRRRTVTTADPSTAYPRASRQRYVDTYRREH